MKITLAHSPDADDAFMFYALQKGKIKTGPYEFEIIFSDIQSLNEEAINSAKYDVTAVSYHAYPYAAQNYALTEAGSSFGDNYGPTLVCNEGENADDLLQKAKNGEIEIAIPGLMTSSYLALKLFAPKVKVAFEAFDQIPDLIKNGKYAAGLIIHEFQVTYQSLGFAKLLNLGEWWFQRNGGLPLPLGANIVRKSLPDSVKSDISLIIKESIEYSLKHREDALHYAMQFGKDLKMSDADRFVGMYVNELTLNLGNRGKNSVEIFLKEAYQLGFIPNLPKIEYV